MSRWCRERRLVVSAICGLICLIGGAALAAEYTFDGVYTGKRSLTKGTPSPTCPAEDNVSVTITGETLTFTNSALKKYLMLFEPSPDGSFGQTHTEEGGAVVHYHGRITGDAIEADVETPDCQYHWQLKKQ